MMKKSFPNVHLGTDALQVQAMLNTLHIDNVDDIINQTIPKTIRTELPETMDNSKTEEDYLKHIEQVACQNKIYKNYIGNGYHPTHMPSVIIRNILEDPGWYTQYTPYQAEIAQGRLEMLFYFQSIICELTQLPITNASLLDEATAAAEALLMIYAKNTKKLTAKSDVHFLMDTHINNQIKNVLYTRVNALGINITEGDVKTTDLTKYQGVVLQFPNQEGSIIDYTTTFDICKQHDIPVCVIADILSLCLLEPLSTMGASIIVGSTQRLGIPMGFGGPHAAYIACKEEYKRFMPGRIIGKTIDRHNNPCFRMALQTREQHIKREKATSNICTAQALLAIMASVYVIYNGKEGLFDIASQIASKTKHLADSLKQYAELEVIHPHYFDTIKIAIADIDTIKNKAEEQGVNFYYYPDKKHIGIAVNEVTTQEDIREIITILTGQKEDAIISSLNENAIPPFATRKTDYLNDAIFNQYTTEHKITRFINSLKAKDLSLTHSMIPLGSCTMKLNPTSALLSLSNPAFANIHPLAPQNQTKGYQYILSELEKMLVTITEMDACSLQPNSGAQGEYAGLMAIRAYFKQLGETQRNIILIPTSAHGTNPASAKMAGFEIVVIRCLETGEIDFTHLQEVCIKYHNTLAGLMITYPSTFGVFDDNICKVTDMIHQYGGQVYMDGANMNAQVGLTSPSKIGADVCHLNLHKTFAIPHGGGGPGVGPICVKKHLSPFLPSTSNFDVPSNNQLQATPIISAAPFGSASICLISYAYIYLMGKDGLKEASIRAIINANYMKKRLENYYPILYTNQNQLCAHEFILDFRAFKKTSNIEIEDIAKRLMDYGFHAPTVSFPVAGTLMIEPTESEDKDELDRFCDALIAIHKEINEIESGKVDKENNLLKNAPHSFETLCKNEWTYTYDREAAAFPLDYVKTRKFWIPISRVNQAFGDRNLICSCTPIEEYMEKNNSNYIKK